MASFTDAELESQKRLGELLVDMGFIDDAQLKTALVRQRQWGKRLGWVLVESGFITETKLVRGLSSQLKLDTCDPVAAPIHDRVKAIVPREVALRLRVVPLHIRRDADGETLHIATADPLDHRAHDELAGLSKMRVQWLLAGESEIDRALERHYSSRPPSLVPVSPMTPVPPPPPPQLSVEDDASSLRPSEQDWPIEEVTLSELAQPVPAPPPAEPKFPSGSWGDLVPSNSEIPVVRVSQVPQPRAPSIEIPIVEEPPPPTPAPQLELQPANGQGAEPAVDLVSAVAAAQALAQEPPAAGAHPPPLDFADETPIQSPSSRRSLPPAAEAFAAAAASLDAGITFPDTSSLEVAIDDVVVPDPRPAAPAPREPDPIAARARAELARFVAGEELDGVTGRWLMRVVAAVILEGDMLSDERITRALSSLSRS